MTKRLLRNSVAGPAPGVKADAVPVAGPATPDRLLEAGAEAFAERGFHATTTRDIATRAGLSPAGLYVHYPSKGALLAHLSLAGHQGALELVRHSLAGPRPAPERLHTMVAAFVTWHAEHHVVARVVQYELRSLDEQTRVQVYALRRQMEDLVQQVIAEGVHSGALRVDILRPATRAVLSLAVDVARWFDPLGRESAQEIGRIYADLALRMLGADPSAHHPSPRSSS